MSVCDILERSCSNVFLAEPTPPDNRDARLFLARYLKRSSLSLERTTLLDSVLAPTVRITQKLDDGDLHRDLSPLEFLAELRQNELSQKLRRNNNAFEEEMTPPVEPPPKAFSSWAALIKQVYEVDPLLCDKCGATMKIVAFLH